MRQMADDRANKVTSCTKNEDPKKQRCLMSQGRVLKDKRTIEEYSIKEGEKIEMSMLLAGGKKNDELMTFGKNDERPVKRITSEPCSETSGIEDAKYNDDRNEEQSVSKKVEDKMEAMMQRMELRMTKTGEAMMTSVNSQMSNVYLMVREMRKDSDVKLDRMNEAFTQKGNAGQAKFSNMDERFTVMKERMDRLENHESGRKNMDEPEKGSNSQNDSDEMKAVAAGFQEDTTQKVETILERTIVTTGMKKESRPSAQRSRSRMHSWNLTEVKKETRT